MTVASYNLLCYSLCNITSSYSLHSSALAKASYQGENLPYSNPKSIVALVGPNKNDWQGAVTRLPTYNALLDYNTIENIPNEFHN